MAHYRNFNVDLAAVMEALNPPTQRRGLTEAPLTSMGNRAWKAPAPPQGISPDALKATEAAFTYLDQRIDQARDMSDPRGGKWLGSTGGEVAGRQKLAQSIPNVQPAFVNYLDKLAADLAKIADPSQPGSVRDTLPMAQIRRQAGIHEEYWRTLLTSLWKNKWVPVPTLNK